MSFTGPALRFLLLGVAGPARGSMCSFCFLLMENDLSSDFLFRTFVFGGMLRFGQLGGDASDAKQWSEPKYLEWKFPVGTVPPKQLLTHAKLS